MSRKEVYIPETRSTQSPRWWQIAAVPVFKAKLADMTTPDLRALGAEIKGVTTLIQSQLESRGKTDIVWWKKARASLGFTSEKRGLVRTEIFTRHSEEQETHREQRLKAHEKRRAEDDSKREQRIETLSRLRKQAQEGDVQGAFIGLLDFFDRSERSNAPT